MALLPPQCPCPRPKLENCRFCGVVVEAPKAWEVSGGSDGFSQRHIRRVGVGPDRDLEEGESPEGQGQALWSLTRELGPDSGGRLVSSALTSRILAVRCARAPTWIL